jgi:hypothetical protein
MQTLRLPIRLQVHQLPFNVLGQSAVQVATREDLTNGEWDHTGCMAPPGTLGWLRDR